VKAFFLGLRKGVRQLAMFPEDPARRAALVKSLCEPLGALLAAGPVAVCVQPDAFTFDHDPVWAAEGTDDTPGLFHRSGVRGLTLQPGLAEDELGALVGVLQSRPERGGEDFATRLFNAALPHLGVTLSETYAFGGLSESQLDLEIQKLVADLERRHAAASPELRARATAVCQGLDLKLETLENKTAPCVLQGQVTSAFAERARQDCAHDDARRLAPQLIALAVSHVRTGAMSDPVRASDLLARLVDSMLAQGNLSPLATLLEALEGLQPPQGPAILQALALKLSDGQRLRTLVRLLNAPNPDLASLARYLAECRSGAAGALLELLPSLEDRHCRLLVLETVAGLDKGAGAALADRLEAEGAAVVPDLLALVERLPAAERGKLFDRAIHNKAPEVRIAALQALAHTSSPEAMHRFVLDATKDGDSRIRAAAWRTLVALVPSRAAQDLSRLPKLPDWDKRPMPEKEFLFECLGRTESEEALAFLSSVLQAPKKGLFGGKRTELKLLAVHALQSMPTLQSFKLLQAVGSMPDQDPEATSTAQKAAAVVKDSVLGAGGAPPRTGAAAGPEILPPELVRALEHIKRRLTARQPPPQTAPAPVAPPTPAAASPSQSAGSQAPDPLLEFPDPVAAPPPWATPVPSDKKRGGGH
jgi:hypothetical protein